VAIKMTKQDRFNSLVFYYTQGTCLDWRRFKWMALVESSLERRAVSEAGALGIIEEERIKSVLFGHFNSHPIEKYSN
jgi:hypothetical protein